MQVNQAKQTEDQRNKLKNKKQPIELNKQSQTNQANPKKKNSDQGANKENKVIAASQIELVSNFVPLLIQLR